MLTYRELRLLELEVLKMKVSTRQSTLGSLFRAAVQTLAQHPNSNKSGLLFRTSPAGGSLERPSSYRTAHSPVLAQRTIFFEVFSSIEDALFDERRSTIGGCF